MEYFTQVYLKSRYNNVVKELTDKGGELIYFSQTK